MGFKIKKPIISEDDILEENSIGAKSILMWGSANSGKSVLSTLIAKKLAERNKDKNVVVVYTDEITPMTNCFFSNSSFENLESLGVLFTPIKVTSELVFSNLTTLKKYNNLALLGFKNCENYAQYPQCSEDIAKQLIRLLNKEFDYIIIDGSTSFIYNQLTSVAFSEVDLCIKLCMQELKSASYFGSNEAFLDTVDINIKKEIVLLNKIDERGIYDEVFNKVNGYNYKLKYSKDLNDIVEKGNLLLDIKDNEFNNQLNNLIKEVF
ncbi:hypothetical protein [uncultured Tyzzerella sp.]|uniref:hypothetical protein n=1 Tax=uncultured Tyzzerella sp. TaxID=2321398 RepID=UPI002943B72E|nr:hypothetical protein [uncultured Tyzzerella sp.]